MVDADNDAYIVPSESSSIYIAPTTESRLGDLEGLTRYILVSIVVSVAGVGITVVIGAVAIIMDQLHFNNALYREGYIQTSDKTNTVTKELVIPKAPLADK